MTTEMLSIRVSDETAGQVRAMAQARKVTVSDLLRAAVEGLLTGQAATLPIDPQELRLAALEYAMTHVVTRLNALEKMTCKTASDAKFVELEVPLSDRDDVFDISPTIELSDTNDVLDKTAMPVFNTEKHRLGKLCSARHDYAATGQSLRSKANGGCLKCMAAAARTRRAQTVRKHDA